MNNEGRKIKQIDEELVELDKLIENIIKEND